MEVNHERPQIHTAPVVPAPSTVATPSVCDVVRCNCRTSPTARLAAIWFVVAIDKKYVRYNKLSNRVVAGPNEANCVTAAPPCVNPTTVVSTKLSRGSDNQINTVVLIKINNSRYVGAVDIVVVVVEEEDDDSSFSSMEDRATAVSLWIPKDDDDDDDEFAGSKGVAASADSTREEVAPL
eukprot:scaffold1276_cov162-Amphora_coffeaeformis.AAC.7